MANNKKLTCLIFLGILILLISPNASQALTCGEVINDLISCLGYLKNGGDPSAVCCDGAKKLYNTANTTSVRRVACACIKQAAQAYSVNYGFANALPPKCGVHVDYKLTPDLDCATIN
ncbi:hypothetical protein RND81_03G010100 [Saponaria officinalis]|uniref:Non-specific lipid-transfer protein n=1 Tax=Saponaria officinalis TaxID=3572 RepID=A0AAW1M4F3_SAPOF